ncbi:ArsR/SmtB family transcription factor [Natronorubrum sp. A-ect3]|uniref:ArsR/SmtB family transcription factor n=1 Tax=Natronorubrum sp. A-ect3 TaxID=3242698 RepID=UPI00359CE618
MATDDSRQDEPPGCDLALSDTALESVTDRSLETQVEIFSTLGNETRYRILLLLSLADEPVCGCEIEPYVDVGQSSISQSLSRLRKAGLVSRTKDGRWRYYEPTEKGKKVIALSETETDKMAAVSD